MKIKNGYWALEWPDGTVYKGNWQNSQFHGQGVLTYSNGESYDG